MPAKKKAAPVEEEIVFPEQYTVVGADLSLRRPGFALLEIEQTGSEAKINSVKLFSVDNKTKKNKTHGRILHEIYDEFSMIQEKCARPVFYVREKMIMNKKVPSERDVAKVVGIMDYALEDTQWYEIYPVTVKAQIAGRGNAEKSEVAEALKNYLGELEYKCDDESDAAAVAVSWLILHNQIPKAKEV